MRGGELGRRDQGGRQDPLADGGGDVLRHLMEENRYLVTHAAAFIARFISFLPSPTFLLLYVDMQSLRTFH